MDVGDTKHDENHLLSDDVDQYLGSLDVKGNTSTSFGFTKLLVTCKKHRVLTAAR